MNTEQLDIKIYITLGRKAAAALNGNGDLLIIQEQPDSDAVINLGPLTEGRARELSSYLHQLTPHS